MLCPPNSHITVCTNSRKAADIPFDTPKLQRSRVLRTIDHTSHLPVVLWRVTPCSREDPLFLEALRALAASKLSGGNEGSIPAARLCSTPKEVLDRVASGLRTGPKVTLHEAPEFMG